MSAVDRDPGWYDETPGEVANLDQIRAELLELVASAPAVMMTVHKAEPDEDGDYGVVHTAFALLEDTADIQAFISFAAVRAIKSMSGCLGVDPEEACRIVLAAIEDMDD